MEATDQNTDDTLLQMAVHTATLENTASSTANWAVVLQENQSLDKDLSAIFEAEARCLRKQLLDEIAFSQWTPDRSSASTIMPPTLDLMSIFGEHALPPTTPALAVPAANLSGKVLSLVDEMLARLQTEAARALWREEWRVFRAAMARQAAFEVDLEQQVAALKQQTQACLDAQKAVLQNHYQEQLVAQKASLELQNWTRTPENTEARMALKDEWAAKLKEAEEKNGALVKQVEAEKAATAKLERELKKVQRMSKERDMTLAVQWAHTVKVQKSQKEVERQLSQANQMIQELESRLHVEEELAAKERAMRTQTEAELTQTTEQIEDLNKRLASEANRTATVSAMRHALVWELVETKKQVGELNYELAVRKKQSTMESTALLRVQGELESHRTLLKTSEAWSMDQHKRIQDGLSHIVALEGSMLLERTRSSKENIARGKAGEAVGACQDQMEHRKQTDQLEN